MNSDPVVLLLDVARRNDRLPADELNALARSCPPGGDARPLARELVRRNALTTFQVNRVLQGQVASLTLGPYLLLEKLGEGGMGQVFKGRHEKLGRDTALKVIRPDRLAHPDALKRFEREARAVARLHHPAVVALYEIGESNGTHFLALEYVAGVTLAQQVAKSGPLPAPLACEFVRQAALGLQHAHEQGVLHRDLKPANLVVTAAGQLKILDMGLATFLGHDGRRDTALTSDGAFLGTPDFVAPEQAVDARSADIRSDIYSLGCTLYLLLTGRPPFADGTSVQKILWHQQAEPPALESLRPDAPAAVAVVVRRMMAKQPARRFQTPAEVAAHLAPHAGLGGLAVVPEGRPVAAAGSTSGVSFGPFNAPTGNEGIPSGSGGHSWSLPLSGSAAASAGNTELLKGATLLDSPAARPAPSRRNWKVLAVAGSGFLLLLLLLLKPFGSGDGDGGGAEQRPPAVRAQGNRDLQGHPVGAARVLSGHASPVQAVAFSPDGKRALSGGGSADSGYAVRLWDLASGDELARLEGHRDVVRGVAFSADGLFGASAGKDGSVRLWNLAERREVRRFECPPSARTPNSFDAVAFSGDGKEIAAAGTTLVVWRVETETVRKQYNTTPAQSILSLNGRWGVTRTSSSYDYLWDLSSDSQGRRVGDFRAVSMGVTTQLHHLALAPEGGRFLARTQTQSSSTTRRPSKGEPVPPPTTGFALFDTVSGKKLRDLDGFPGSIRAAAFAPDGSCALSGGSDKVVRLWGLPPLSTAQPLSRPVGQLHSFDGHTGEVVSVAFSADGRLALSGAEDGTLRLWVLPKP